MPSETQGLSHKEINKEAKRETDKGQCILLESNFHKLLML